MGQLLVHDPARHTGRELSRGNTTRKMVSYTFDARADLGYAGRILDLLRSNGIKASFGMTGKWAAANPTYVQRMKNEGHHIFTTPGATGPSPGSPPAGPL